MPAQTCHGVTLTLTEMPQKWLFWHYYIFQSCTRAPLHTYSLQISLWSYHHPTSMLHSLIAFIHPQKLCLLKILIKITVKIKVFNTTENDEMGLQKINRPWTRLSPSCFCDGKKPCIVTIIQYSWNSAVIKECFQRLYANLTCSLHK